MATTLTVSGLPEYIQVNRDELFVKSVAGFRSLDYIDIMPGVKHKEAFNYLDSTVVLADGSECGFNPQGSDTFSQRYIEVHPVEIEKEWCWKQFKEKYMNHQLLWEAGREKLPFEEAIANSNVAAIQEALENLVWQGNASLGINGFINDAKAVSATTVETATGETVTERIDNIVAALPVAMLKKGVNIYLSLTDFRNYVQEANGTCCANRPVIDAAVDSLTYAGDSRITLVPVSGLEGTGVIMAATKDALVYGTDLEDSDKVYRLWYNEDEEKFRFRVLFMAGTGIRFIDEVIYSEA